MFIIDLFLKPVFWIIMGMLYLIMIYSARYWAQDLNLQMNWWKWLLSAAWFILLSLSLAGGMTLIGEGETQAGLYFLGLFLLIDIILGVGLWRLITMKSKKKRV